MSLIEKSDLHSYIISKEFFNYPTAVESSRNGIVLGGDLHQLVKKYDDYRFQEVKGYSVGFTYSYPVYSLTRKALSD